MSEWSKPLSEIEHLGDEALTREFYNGRITQHADFWRSPAERAWMKPFTPLPGPILDLGCGNGAVLIKHALRGHAGVGIDVSDVVLSIMAERVAKLPADVASRLRWSRGMIESYSDGSLYPNVVCTEVLEHVADPVAILAVASRHLAPGGRLYVSAPAKRVGSTPESHVRGVELSSLSEWAKQVGLKVDRVSARGASTISYLTRV